MSVFMGHGLKASWKRRTFYTADGLRLLSTRVTFSNGLLFRLDSPNVKDINTQKSFEVEGFQCTECDLKAMRANFIAGSFDSLWVAVIGQGFEEPLKATFDGVTPKAMRKELREAAKAIPVEHAPNCGFW